ncbi:hypothetical protein PHYPSEUDO_006822 [Phytophthora pseudosyringae]|uniref:RING-type domain-containing protein n=1 Tax=Phytophthora pseudosyringae TaxID=221518 RepID=A0A8T1VHN2_9STRA|nr:hypothetical protein PHYPSEUDO_006822 [Phytophthora pseudosyringae]
MRSSTSNVVDVTHLWNWSPKAECSTAALDGAASNGHLSVVKWLHKNRAEGCTTAAMDEAATNGHFSTVLWLHCNRGEGCTTAAVNGAAGNGFLLVVDWLKQNRSEGCTAAAMLTAASKGFLEVVEFLHTNLNQQATNAAIAAAASNGHLPVVQYLHDNHSERCAADAITRASRNGHGTVVEFLLQHEGCRRAYDEDRFMVRADDESIQALEASVPSPDEETEQDAPSKTLEFCEAEAGGRTELEARLHAEEEAKIRVEEEPRIRAEVETAVRAEQEEALMRAKIRAEIQEEVEMKMRAEIRSELLAKKKTEPCAICFGNIEDPITTVCGHSFCSGCLKKWRSGGHDSVQASLRQNMHKMQSPRFRWLLLVSFIVLALHNTLGTNASTPAPVKMANSNPVFEMIVEDAPVRLILTTDLDGIVVCEDASTSRRDWLMTDSEFDNARKRLRYELHSVVPEVKERAVQVPSLGYRGRINVGHFRLDNQEMRMAAVAYYLGSLDADGFIGAGFAFHPDHSPLWETIQETGADRYGYLYHGREHSMKTKKESAFTDAKEVKLAAKSDNGEGFDRDDYVWSEPFVSLGDDSDGVSNAQGISFPIHEASFACNLPSESGRDTTATKTQAVQLFGNFSSSWDVVVDFNVPCLQLPKEFYDSLAGWIGLRLNSRLGLSEVTPPASALPDVLFSLSFTGTQLALPLRSLVLPELSELSSPSTDENSTKICIQRSASMLQRGTAAFAAPTTTAAEVARLQRLHGASGIPVYNMIDSPIVFGAMVLDALGSVVFDGIRKRTGILKPSAMGTSAKRATCLQPESCTGQQEYITHLNVCQDPDCSQYYFHSLNEDTKYCVIDTSWTGVLAVTTALFVAAELFFSLSLRRLVVLSQQGANSFERQHTARTN